MSSTASSSRAMRSPTAPPKSMPKAVCSVSNQAAPMPSTARPADRWSSAVTILTTSPGLRNVLAPTSSPSVARVVTWLQPPSTM